MVEMLLQKIMSENILYEVGEYYMGAFSCFTTRLFNLPSPLILKI